MVKFLIKLLLVLLVFGCGSNNNLENASSNFTRSECIVLVNFEFDESKTDDVASAIADSIVLARQNNAFFSIAGAAFPNLSYRYKKAYFQLNKDCNNKTTIINNFFDKFWVLSDDDSISYSVSDEVIQPSKKTIDLTGDSWVDR